MESRENRHFLFDFAQELLDSEELRPELELLIDEFFYPTWNFGQALACMSTRYTERGKFFSTPERGAANACRRVEQSGSSPAS
jgi:hypothetical protein